MCLTTLAYHFQDPFQKSVVFYIVPHNTAMWHGLRTGLHCPVWQADPRFYAECKVTEKGRWYAIVYYLCVLWHFLNLLAIVRLSSDASQPNQTCHSHFWQTQLYRKVRPVQGWTRQPAPPHNPRVVCRNPRVTRGFFLSRPLPWAHLFCVFLRFFQFLFNSARSAEIKI